MHICPALDYGRSRHQKESQLTPGHKFAENFAAKGHWVFPPAFLDYDLICQL